MTTCQGSHGSSLEKQLCVLHCRLPFLLGWSRVFFTWSGPLKLAYNKLNQDPAINKCKILHWHSFNLLWAWQRLHLSLGLHGEGHCPYQSASPPHLSLSSSLGHTELREHSFPCRFKMGGQQFSWSFQSCWSWNPQSSKPPAPAGYLLCCFQTMGLCERNQLLVSPERSDGEGRALLVPHRSCCSWALSHDFLLGSRFYLSIPFHLYTAWKALRYWTGCRDCCWTAPAGPHHSLGGGLGRGAGHRGWEKPFPHPWCRRQLWGGSVGVLKCTSLGVLLWSQCGWWSICVLLYSETSDVNQTPPGQTGHRQVFIRLQWNVSKTPSPGRDGGRGDPLFPVSGVANAPSCFPGRNGHYC